jgi:hypothetical protein
MESRLKSSLLGILISHVWWWYFASPKSALAGDISPSFRGRTGTDNLGLKAP